MVFYIKTKSGQYSKNIKLKTNIALNYKNKKFIYKDKLFNCKNKIKIKIK